MNPHRHTPTRLTAATALTTGMLLLTGCSQQQWRDLEGQTQTEPDKVRLVTDVDGFPNIVALCVNGAGFAATTRDQSNAALQHIDAWDAPDGWCGDGTPR